MAIADTYNGDLVRIKQKCPEAGGDFDTELTECQEQYYAYINMKLDSADASPPVTGDDNDNALKTIEALGGGGLFKEQQIFSADDKDYGRKSQERKTADEWLEMWIANKFGSTGDEADTFSIHQKVSRPAHIAASQFGDDRDVI